MFRKLKEREMDSKSQILHNSEKREKCKTSTKDKDKKKKKHAAVSERGQCPEL